MKRLVLAGSLCALAVTAFAQSTSEQQVVVPASKEAAIQRSYMSPEDFARYKGAYSLSNGKTLYLIRKATRMYARVDEQSEHEVTRSGRGKFQALDGKMWMALEFAPDDSVSGELNYIDESPSVAGLKGTVVSVQFAAR